MNVLLIEDEAPAAKRLEGLIMQLRPGTVVLDVQDTVEGAVDWFKTHPAPDLVFMDIQLADGICFSIFEQVQVPGPVIFTTAFDQYALEAFKVNSVDYLLKPIKADELQQALNKYEKLQQPASRPDYTKLAAAIKKMDSLYKRRFLIRVGPTIRTVPTEDISYFYSEAKSTFVVTKLARTFTLDESLDKLEAMLDPSRFYRVNRKFIVALDSIEAMHTYSKARVLLELNPPYTEKVVVSTERSPHFKKWLAGED